MVFYRMSMLLYLYDYELRKPFNLNCNKRSRNWTTYPHLDLWMTLYHPSDSPSSSKFKSKLKTLIGDWKTVIIRFAFVPLAGSSGTQNKKMNFIFDIGLTTGEHEKPIQPRLQFCYSLSALTVLEIQLKFPSVPWNTYKT